LSVFLKAIILTIKAMGPERIPIRAQITKRKIRPCIFPSPY